MMRAKIHLHFSYIVQSIFLIYNIKIEKNENYGILLGVKGNLFHDKKCRNRTYFKTKYTIATLNIL